MIPNFAPMAAVYLDGSRLSSRPIVALCPDTREALVIRGTDGRVVAAAPKKTVSLEFLGIFPGAWTPTYDEMSSLLPPRTPGEPDPLATRVVLVELTSGTWEARRVRDRACVISAFSFADLERKLAAIGCFHIEKVIPLGDDH